MFIVEIIFNVWNCKVGWEEENHAKSFKCCNWIPSPWQQAASDDVQPATVASAEGQLWRYNSLLILKAAFTFSEEVYYISPTAIDHQIGEGGCFPLFLWIEQLIGFILAGSQNPCKGKDKHRKGEGWNGTEGLARGGVIWTCTSKEQS